MSGPSTVVAAPPSPVGFLAAMARPLILSRFREDSCIVSTAIACDFLSWAGVMVKPWEVEVLVYNAAGAALIDAGVPLTDWPDDAWSVGIVQGEHEQNARKPRAWSGAHLVALTHSGVIVDLSADQLHRPAKGINVPAPVIINWLPDAVRATNRDGAVLVYRRPERPDPSFRQSPDWRDRSRRADIVRELIRLARLAGIGS